MLRSKIQLAAPKNKAEPLSTTGGNPSSEYNFNFLVSLSRNQARCKKKIRV
tara:strand:+ start:4333 stop:4485 length:153 start_codon:yes stop_codon:yes gene_type:complete